MTLILNFNQVRIQYKIIHPTVDFSMAQFEYSVVVKRAMAKRNDSDGADAVH